MKIWAFDQGASGAFRCSLKFASGALAALAVAWTAGPAQAVTYTFQNIVDPLDPTFTQALGINNAGTIVGYGNATIFNGFQLTLPANFTRENFPGATGGTQVVGIDSRRTLVGAGNTVGFYINPDATTHGFFKPAGGAFQTVDQPGSVFNQLLGINQNGNEIAGYSSFTDVAGATGQQAFSLTGTTYTNINSLLPTNSNSQATGVNNSGEVVGFYQLPGTQNFSAFIDVAGSITSFQAPGAMSTQALGVNDLGQIVGDFVDNMDVMHGFLDSNGIFTTLDPNGSTATTINGISNSGRVVGFFVDANGNTIGVVGTAVPEPATMLLLGTGLLGFGLLRRRRREASRRPV